MNNSHLPDFRQQMALRVYRTYRRLQARLHQLTYLFWECTVRCNIQCLHCGSDCSANDGSSDMPAQEFLNVTSKIREQYNPNRIMVVLTGGEPLIRYDLEEIGYELYKQGYPWGLVTNGYALTEKRFQKLLQSGLRSITISLDGTEDNHNWLRGSLFSFSKVVEAIKMAALTNDIAFDVVTCVNGRNISRLHEIRELLVSLKVRNWRLFTISPIGRAGDLPELFLSSQEFVTMMNFIKNCRHERRIIAAYGCEGYLGRYEGKVRAGYFFCRAGINVASVLNDGSISACPNNSRHVIQGNIYEDDFIDIWENRFQLMRNRQWAKTGKCANCKQFKWCEGNGLHLRDFEKEDVMLCHYEMLSGK